MTCVTFEGPDGVGKSGYSEWFAREIGYVHVPQRFTEFPHQDHDLLGYARHQTVKAFDDAGVNSVLDRGPLSSVVYAHVRDRPTPEYAWDSLEALEPIIVYMTCDPEELDVRHQDDIEAEELITEYEAVIDGLPSRYNVYVIDTTSGALGDLRTITDDL